MENENKSFDEMISKVGFDEVEGVRMIDDDGAYVGRADDDGERLDNVSQKMCSCLDHQLSPLCSNMSILLMRRS